MGYPHLYWWWLFDRLRSLKNEGALLLAALRAFWIIHCTRRSWMAPYLSIMWTYHKISNCWNYYESTICLDFCNIFRSSSKYLGKTKYNFPIINQPTCSSWILFEKNHKRAFPSMVEYSISKFTRKWLQSSWNEWVWQGHYDSSLSYLIRWLNLMRILYFLIQNQQIYGNNLLFKIFKILYILSLH